MQRNKTLVRQPAPERRLPFFNRVGVNGDPVHDRIEALIGASVNVMGDVAFAGGLRIDGQVHGDVVVSGVDAGTLTIGDGGCINGNVRVSHLVVYGQIYGSVHATGLVEVCANARIVGDVHYGLLKMQAGGQIKGHLVRHKPDSGY